MGWTKEEGLEAEVGVCFWGEGTGEGGEAAATTTVRSSVRGVSADKRACMGQTVHLLLAGSMPGIDSPVVLPGHYDVQVLKKYIYGGHVAEYMEEMEEEDPEKYNRWVAQEWGAKRASMCLHSLSGWCVAGWCGGLVSSLSAFVTPS